MKGKRGLSSVVAVLLIILLTVAAVTIVATFLIPFVRDNLTKSTECLPYQGHYTFQETFETSTDVYRYNCYQIIRVNEVLIGTSIRAGGLEEKDEENLDGFDLLFLKEGTSVKANVRASGSDGKISMLNGDPIKIPGSGEVQTYVYDAGVITYESIEVYPVLKSGKLCDKSDSIKLISCNGNILT